MKNFYAALLLLAAPCPLFAQPTVTNAEDFKAGTVLKFQHCSPAGVQAGPSGAARTWDFASLAALPDTTVERILDAAATPHAALFPGANLAEQYDDGRYVYMNKKATENLMLGFLDTAQQLVIQYPRPLLFASRPLTYGSFRSDTYTTDYTVSGMRFRGAGRVTMEADGYGTLRLPNGTHPDVLRLKISVVQADTLLPFGTVSETTTTTYVWFDGIRPSALLKLDSVRSGMFASASVEYLLSETVTSVPEASGVQALLLYPNPAADQVQVQTEPGSVLLVRNALGQVVWQQTAEATTTRLPLSALPAGLYTLTSHTRTQTRVGKLLVQR